MYNLGAFIMQNHSYIWTTNIIHNSFLLHIIYVIHLDFLFYLLFLKLVHLDSLFYLLFFAPLDHIIAFEVQVSHRKTFLIPDSKFAILMVLMYSGEDQPDNGQFRG